MKGMKGRYCFLASCIWIIIWSTIVYRLDGNYPGDYMLWFVIVGVIGTFIPWVFAEEEFYETTEEHKTRIKAQQNQTGTKPKEENK